MGGSDNIDKATLARYFAWHLSKSNDGSGRSVKEWQRSSDPQSIEVELQKSEKPSIYIFTQVSPQNVGYNLIGIKKAATLGQHYVVITTDIPQAGWKLAKENENFWKDLYLEQEILYSSDNLVKVLFQALMEVETPLPPVLQNEILNPNQLIVGRFTFQKVAELLQTPARVFNFVQSLQTELKGKILNEILIDNLISVHPET